MNDGYILIGLSFCLSHICHTAAYLAKIFSFLFRRGLSEAKLTIYRFI